MVADITVIATAAISGSIGLAAAAMQARTSRHQIDAETERQHWAQVQARRGDRRDTYLNAISLVNDWMWSEDTQRAGYDVLEQFTKPFVHAATAVRVYGSPEAISAIDVIQTGLRQLNAAREGPDLKGEQIDQSYETISAGLDALVVAARADVGPRREDALPNAEFRRGGGPRT